MILKNLLYVISTWSNNGDGTFKFDINLLPDNFIYKAHFPNKPITPGVCIIKMCIELLGIALNKKIILKRVKNAKFIDAIRPNVISSIVVHINKITDTEDGTKVEYAISNGDAVLTKMNLIVDINN